MSQDQLNTGVKAEGHRFCDIRINRLLDGSGIKVNVKTTPQFEELIRQWGFGVTQTVLEYGRLWIPVEEGQKLEVYHLNQHTGVQPMQGGYFRLDRPAQPLLEDSIDYAGGIVNISWLRLVGIGKDSGVSFKVPGVFSLEYLRNLLQRHTQASKKLYTDFLLPVHLSVVMSTQEIGGPR